MRYNLQEEVLRIHERFKIPTIMVTHDVADVMRLSKCVFVLQEGVIKEDDSYLRFLSVTQNSK